MRTLSVKQLYNNDYGWTIRNREALRVDLDAPFFVRHYQIKAGYFIQRTDCPRSRSPLARLAYSIDYYKEPFYLGYVPIERMVEEGEPRWMDVDFSDPDDAFDQAALCFLNGRRRVNDIYDDALASFYDVKTDAVRVYLRKNGEAEQIFDGDAEQLIKIQQDRQKQVEKYAAEYESRKAEYLDLLEKTAKRIIQKSQDECAVIFSDDVRYRWKLQKLDEAQNLVIKELGYDE